MGLLTRTEKGNKLNISEMDANLKYLQGAANADNYPNRAYVKNRRWMQFMETSESSDYSIIQLFGTDMITPIDGIYVYANIQTFLKFAEAMKIKSGNSLLGTPTEPQRFIYPFNDTTIYNLNVTSSLSSYINLANGMGINPSYDPSPIHLQFGKTKFAESWIEMCEDPAYQNYFITSGEWTNADTITNFLDVGIVEFGVLGATANINFGDILKNWPTNVQNYNKVQEVVLTKIEFSPNSIADDILSSGIVVQTSTKGGLWISDVDTYTKQYTA